jgi:hypothetical protein
VIVIATLQAASLSTLCVTRPPPSPALKACLVTMVTQVTQEMGCHTGMMAVRPRRLCFTMGLITGTGGDVASSQRDSRRMFTDCNVPDEMAGGECEGRPEGPIIRVEPSDARRAAVLSAIGVTTLDPSVR